MASAAEDRLKKISRYVLSCVMAVGLTLGLSRAGLTADNLEPSTFIWPKNQSFMITRVSDGNSLQRRAFMQSECVSEIITRLHILVPWNKVKKHSTREKIWALYTKGRTISFKINGFLVGDLHQTNRGTHATCNFKAVTPLIDFSEDTILKSTGLKKYF